MKKNKLILITIGLLISLGLLWATMVYFQIDPSVCTSCGICLPVCDQGAIEFSHVTFTYSINPELCNACGECFETCANGAIFQVVDNENNSVKPDKFSLFPNPVKDQFSISLNNSDRSEIIGTVSIFNSKGQKIKTLENINSNKLILNVNELGLNSGVYFIKLSNSDDVFTKRIVVLK